MAEPSEPSEPSGPDTSPALVVGASGFLGSNVVRLLLSRGRPVRALVRKTSRLDALEGLDPDYRYGDVTDQDSLADAMDGCGSVFHCAVDTRAWLSDPAPLFRCNVDGLVNSMEAALRTRIRRFVFTSSIATVGLDPNRPVHEGDAFNWQDRAPAYVLSRVRAEDRLMDYCRSKGLPGVALCVANTYGPGDVQPTPHGELLWQAAKGRLPFALNAGVPSVDIRDAAQALILAEAKGRVGERYVIAADHVSQRELFALAAGHLGNRPPRILPMPLAMLAARTAKGVLTLAGRKDFRLRPESILLAGVFGEFDASKARSELGWQPRPLPETVADAVRWFSDQNPKVAKHLGA